MAENVAISDDDLAFIRRLGDFDLIMLISEVNDHGWEDAKKMIPLMREAPAVQAALK